MVPARFGSLAVLIRNYRMDAARAATTNVPTDRSGEIDMPNRRNVMRTSLGVLAATQLGAGGATAADAPVAATGHGKVRGSDDGGIKVFKGIPYATAKRFEAPMSPQAWAGIRDAIAYGPMCPQLDRERTSITSSWTYEKEMSEDCLVLNVWTPGLRRPPASGRSWSGCTAAASPSAVGLAPLYRRQRPRRQAATWSSSRSTTG